GQPRWRLVNGIVVATCGNALMASSLDMISTGLRPACSRPTPGSGTAQKRSPRFTRRPRRARPATAPARPARRTSRDGTPPGDVARQRSLPDPAGPGLVPAHQPDWLGNAGHAAALVPADGSAL